MPARKASASSSARRRSNANRGRSSSSHRSPGSRPPVLTISRYDSRSLLIDETMDDDLGKIFKPAVMDEKLLQMLSRRGKAAYHCPDGWECTLGGVELGGNKLIVFRHNSAFRQHVERHIKPFKCGVEGCWKKGGFARPITLRKHQSVCRLRATQRQGA